MATTDSDHLPFRTITGADSFDIWRRITNSIGRDSLVSSAESGSLYLDNFDWTTRLVNPYGGPTGGGYVGSSLDANQFGTNQGEVTESMLDVIDATTTSVSNTLGNFNMNTGETTVTSTNPNGQQAYYDVANNGIRITGKSDQWIRVKTRIPIDVTAQYGVKVRIKNLSPSGNAVINNVYMGTASLNPAFLTYAADASRTFNYWGDASMGAAGGSGARIRLPSNAAGDEITEFSEVLGPGYNPRYGSGGVYSSSGKKFDPRAKYFDLIIINHYTNSGDGTGWSAGNDIVILGIEIERLPAGITFTEHDDVDGVPQAKLQVGY